MGLPGLAVHEARCLFREIVRLHQTKLPEKMRGLGDAFLKREFRQHLFGGTCTPRQFEMFMAHWRKYGATIRRQENVIGKKMMKTEREKLSEEQRRQYDKLRRAVAREAAEKET
ncbi:unnamed protein product [Vitrella brassicaformis CCMP3155]|uniref:Succinate dehydrogenase assembly factor 3 n=1 Tax=Vitrella brassicaformis (strain CCMP3155) TaxID=1169540 RepID=A0A0G4F4W3_VITBC|nr:unnamed protein product [Vitrella brassicaformis CCMP3155]|mmetsp:Transcript_19750/g.47904  ORF Transcript_19750/g.47904 Transcript_19750/m.47904 type:complete len:114 (-) Transcript_19750:29-370(-)|eukprot:CEM06757.1 unnamed protein product [Vitrella brassicaformis CCMP3155]